MVIVPWALVPCQWKWGLPGEGTIKRWNGVLQGRGRKKSIYLFLTPTRASRSNKGAKWGKQLAKYATGNRVHVCSGPSPAGILRLSICSTVCNIHIQCVPFMADWRAERHTYRHTCKQCHHRLAGRQTDSPNGHFSFALHYFFMWTVL